MQKDIEREARKKEKEEEETEMKEIVRKELFERMPNKNLKKGIIAEEDGR